jgi:restriction system protein
MLLSHKRNIYFDIIVDLLKASWWVFVKLTFIVYCIVLCLSKIINYLVNYTEYKVYGFSYDDIFNKINHMSGRQFEVLMAEVFKQQGYEVELTPAQQDGGKDIILFLDDETTYVECKRWDSDNNGFYISRPELQKLVGAAVGDKADNMLFVTTGKYNNNAYEYAKKIDNLVLWNMSDIQKAIKDVSTDKIPNIMAKVSLYE